MAVGAPRPDWAEIDPNIWNNSKIYVDSYAGAMAESGDLLDSKAKIEMELGAFICQEKPQNGTQRTIFKSLGLAVEDLVAAKMTFEQVGSNSEKVPFEVLDKDQTKAKIAEVTSQKFVKPLRIVSNKVTNFECEAMLVNYDIMVCELKTNSTNLALIYKAKTGQLVKILDLALVQVLTTEKLNFYNSLHVE